MNGGYAYTSTLKAYLWPLHYEQLFRHNASAVRSSERLLHSLQSFLPRVDLDSRVSSRVAENRVASIRIACRDSSRAAIRVNEELAVKLPAAEQNGL